MDKPTPWSGDAGEWLYLSQRDLDDARTLISRYKPSIENACYLSQQSTEKAFKAFLLFSGEPIAFTHDLNNLCNKCVNINPSFQALEKNAAFINPFSTRTRYMRCPDITEEMGKLAVKRAEEVFNFVKNIIESTQTPPES